MQIQDFLERSDEVATALKDNKPLVALESTIITHGMPYPQNLEMAQKVEAIIRDRGAVPATVAIMDGRMKAGLSAAELERLAQLRGSALKASRRDLASALATREPAGTTVAATMQIAAFAGIQIFATGGIGGVHRGASESFDISADLNELAKTQVAVVCAGAKSILDIAKTLEVLETNGVPIIGYRTDAFPAFYTRDSGNAVGQRFDEPEAVAEMLQIQWQLGMGGVLIANPIPAAFEMDPKEIEAIIGDALASANDKGIGGKELTPYLLQKIFDLSGGKSLVANIALVEHNAAIAADIAVAFATATK